jgi:hypothetical protein
MELAWMIFDRVADTLGALGAVAAFGVVLAGITYWVLNRTR